MDNIRGIGPGFGDNNIRKNIKKASEKYPSFKETLNGFLSDVNKMQLQADDSIKRMAAGEITDIHQVMNSVEEAKTAFNMMMEIRNKVLDAYNEIMRMRL